MSEFNEYVAAMRQFPASVNLITTGNGTGRAGFTATAVMSLTANPAQLGIAVNHNVSAYRDFVSNSRFCVNTLAGHHSDLAARFAGAVKGAERFETGRWLQSPLGCPRLGDALLSFDCELVQQIDLSTHTLFVGRVRDIWKNGAVKPLLYVDGTWASLLPGGESDVDGIVDSVERSVDAFDKAIAAGSNPTEQLDSFVNNFTKFYIDQQKIAHRYLGAELYVAPESLDRVNAVRRRFDDKLTQFLERGKEDGHFNFENSRLTAFAISGLIGWTHRWFRPDGPLSADQIAQILSRLVANMIVRENGAKRIVD